MSARRPRRGRTGRRCATSCGTSKGLGRRHGNRVDADRGQHQPEADADRPARHQGRGQEPEQASVRWSARWSSRPNAMPRRSGTECPTSQRTRGWDERRRTHDQPAEQGRGRTTIALLPGARPAAAAPSHDWIATRSARVMPELPAARRERYEEVLGLVTYDAGVLTADVALADYFDQSRGRGDRAQVGRQLGDRRVQPAAEPACRRWTAHRTRL